MSATRQSVSVCGTLFFFFDSSLTQNMVQLQVIEGKIIVNALKEIPGKSILVRFSGSLKVSTILLLFQHWRKRKDEPF